MYQYLDGFFVYGTFRNFFTGDQFPNEGWHTEAEFFGVYSLPLFLVHTAHKTHNTYSTHCSLNDTLHFLDVVFISFHLLHKTKYMRVTCVD
jgi:hypothetical protein